MGKSYFHNGIRWVLHTVEDLPLSPSAQAERCSVPTEEPPTLRSMKAARVIEYCPDARGSQRFVVAAVAGGAPLAKCRGLRRAEKLAKGREIGEGPAMRALRLRFWLRVTDVCFWACGLGSRPYLWALGKASECVNWGSP